MFITEDGEVHVEKVHAGQIILILNMFATGEYWLKIVAANGVITWVELPKPFSESEHGYVMFGKLLRTATHQVKIPESKEGIEYNKIGYRFGYNYNDVPHSTNGASSSEMEPYPENEIMHELSLACAGDDSLVKMLRDCSPKRRHQHPKDETTIP